MIKKNIISVLFILSFTLVNAQIYKNDSLRGSFSYLLKSRPNLLYPSNVYQEMFSLQVSDIRSFYISEVLLKRDSIIKKEFDTAFKNDCQNIDFRGKSFPKTSSRFLIVQDNNQSIFYGDVGNSILYYTNPRINNWELVNETKTISTLPCKKALLNYKGRNWTAWYSTEISLPFGPYKFGGLPGLIVKITDSKGDYDFELIKATSSKQLKGKTISIDKKYYDRATLVTKKEMMNAKDNFRKNILQSLENDGAILSQEQKQKIIEKQKKDEVEKKGYNPIELEE